MAHMSKEEIKIMFDECMSSSDININGKIFRALDGDFRKAFVLTRLISHFQLAGFSPIRITIGQTKKDKALTLCSLFSISKRAIQNILHGIGTKVTKWNTSDSILEYMRDEMGVLLNINPDVFSAQVMKNEGNRPKGLALRPKGLSHRENDMSDDGVQPPLIYLPKDNSSSSLHSEEEFKYKENVKKKNAHLLTQSKTHAEGLTDSVPLELQNHESWKSIRPYFHDWMEQLLENKSTAKQLKPSLMQSIGRRILDMLRKYDSEQINEQIAYSTSKGYVMLYSPKGDRRLSGRGSTPGPQTRDVLRLFADVSAENPYPFICSQEIDIIDTSMMSVIEACRIDERDISESDQASFRAWMWVCTRFVETMWECSFQWDDKLEKFIYEPGRERGMSDNWLESFDYWKNRGSHDRKLYTRRAFLFVQRWLTKNLPEWIHSLKAFGRDTKLTRMVFDDLHLGAHSMVVYRRMDIPAFFDREMAAVMSDEFRKDFDHYWIDTTTPRWNCGKDGKSRVIILDPEKEWVPYIKGSEHWENTNTFGWNG
jgi:hypothetical protein